MDSRSLVKRGATGALRAIFAAVGLRAVVPILPGIKSINVEMGDVEIIRDVLATLKDETSKATSIVGFSVGGGLALVTATDPGLRDGVDPIILVGPYYSLP